MFNPCCCTVDCTIFSDDFNRADDTDLGADWTEVSGSWAIVSNELTTSSSNARCSASSAAGGYRSALFRFKATTNGDEIVFSTPAAAEDNFIRFTIGGGIEWCNSVTAEEVIAYTDDVTFSANTWYSVRIETGAIYINDTMALNIGNWYESTAFLYHALGTGTVTGSVYFDDFYIIKNASQLTGCPVSPDCGWFLSLSQPASVTVVIAGATDDGVGNDFSPLNGTYVLDDICGTCVHSLAITKTVTVGGVNRDIVAITLASGFTIGSEAFRVALSTTGTCDYLIGVSLWYQAYFLGVDPADDSAGNSSFSGTFTGAAYNGATYDAKANMGNITVSY